MKYYLVSEEKLQKLLSNISELPLKHALIPYQLIQDMAKELIADEQLLLRIQELKNPKLNKEKD